MTYIPTNIQGQTDTTNQNSVINRLWIFEDINEINTNSKTDLQISQYDSLKGYDPTKGFKIVRDNRKLAHNYDWANKAPTATGSNGLPQASMGLRMVYSGFPLNSTVGIGHIKFTWYITFRG